ncbi:MAG: sulfatase-like hydrolase/transferase [Bacteroidia bacterium]|nr:sulfatase-like hydrolase/transferase [Bacteroidia bacterium]
MKNQINKGALGCSVLAVLTSAGAYSQKLPDKPNILIIMTDQLSSESMSCNLGSKYLKTPNMDYLADHGVSFTNAYCANPLCIPSRSSLFTGRYPHELGIQSNVDKMIDPVEFPTLGTILKNAGYETGYVGKWHLPYDRNQPDSHGFAYLPDKKGNGLDSLSPGSAINFLDKQRQHPFFLVVSFMNPHNICQWPRGQKLPDGAIGYPPPADQCPPLRANAMPSKNETDIMQLIRTSYQASNTFPVSGFTDEKWRKYIWAYYRMIEKVDGEIGKILNSLRESGLDKNTLIVFMSDHGDCQGAHRWNQKTVFYEEASKVPFIISSKSLKPRKSDYLVQTGIDLRPTLCEFAGIPLSENNRGVSLKQLITNETAPVERKYVVVSDHLVQGEAVNGQKPEPEGRMLRNRQFKYWIYNEGNQKETLYDLQNDPGEMVNLASDPKFSSELKNCRSQLIEWAKKNNDPYIKYMMK